MTDLQKRIAIAEYCGWVGDFITITDLNCPGMVNPKTGIIECIPDYWNDLNAIFDAEDVFTTARRMRFLINLSWIVRCTESEFGPLSDHDLHWLTIHSPASVRADAFLKTIQQP